MTEAENVSSSSPFETGNIVTGEKFIGRDEYINRCLKKLKGGGSVALRGIPRIGKTSLAVKLLNSLEDQIDGWNIVSIFIDLSTCLTFFHFWRRVVDEIEKTYDGVTTDITLGELLHNVKTASDDYEKISDAIRSIFTYLCKIKVRTVLCIDEFDSVCRVFGESIQESSVCYFMFMRELMTKPGLFGISLIITSRRSLVNLTKKADGGSVFHNAIETIPIHGFNNREIGAFREYAEKYGLELSEEDWAVLEDQAGRSPYMLSMSATALLDAKNGKSVKQALIDYEPTHYQYFDDLLEFLRENDNRDLKHMIQIFIGPEYNLNQNDINELIHSGYIWQETVCGEVQYTTLSARFQRYLGEEARKGLDQAIWPLMGGTERSVRDAIEKGMRKVYGDKWEDELYNKANSKAGRGPFIDKDKIDKFKRDPQKQRLVDRLGFLEYMNIIVEYWEDIFKYIFKEWTPKSIQFSFYSIHRARNPLAHNNGHLLSTLQVDEADLACKKILECLR